jgi:hypothetical protein
MSDKWRPVEPKRPRSRKRSLTDAEETRLKWWAENGAGQEQLRSYVSLLIRELRELREAGSEVDQVIRSVMEAAGGESWINFTAEWKPHRKIQIEAAVMSDAPGKTVGFFPDSCGELGESLPMTLRKLLRAVQSNAGR